MRQKIVKWLALSSTLALVAATLVGIADAHIGVSHSPFTTDGPDLRYVSLDGSDVDFCFDEEVTGPQPLVPGKFGVRGYNSSTVAVSDDADIDDTDTRCVQVGFDDARAIEQFTMGVVLVSAVENSQGNGNVTSSAALTDSEVDNGPGITDAPNLARNFKIDSIEFVMDERMNCAAMGASAFGYYKDAGEGSEAYGTGVGDCNGSEVVIEFDDPVEDIARVFVDPPSGAEPCAPAPSGACIGWEAEGDETGDPDLEGAERDGEDVTFSFDEDITGDPDEAQFQVAAEDGTKYVPAGDSCEIESDEVTCEFPAIDDAAEGDIVLAGVGDCAVDSDEDGQCNTIGDASIDTSGHAPGASDGPDLESCDVNESDATATFVFDEPADEGSADAAKFGVFDGSGDANAGDDVSGSSDNSITVDFASAEVEGGVGCLVLFDAVADGLGNQSPEASVGLVQPTPTQSTTAGPSTPPPPEVFSVPTQLSIQHANGQGAFVGAAKSERDACRRGRKVTVKKQRLNSSRSVGSDTTDASGRFKVPQRRAAGRYFAIVKEKTFTAEGDTFVCQRGRSKTIRVSGRR